MFITLQNDANKEKYFELLKMIGGLSKLFSDSPIPYLYYRSAENIFCKAFGADNLSRSDCSADARVSDLGLGLKTFLNNNGKTFQKIAEFNKNRKDYIEESNIEKLIDRIIYMRNKRIESTKTIHGIDTMIYHCVAREKDKFLIYEEAMEYINEKAIKNISKKNNSIVFEDNRNQYNFNISKSTLYKRFYTPSDHINIDVKIFDNPFQLLENFNNKWEEIEVNDLREKEYVILPLYSFLNNKVMEKSGLNQWNASGRARNQDEIYIPVPMIIHKRFPDFFPHKGKEFNLILPNKSILSAKMCQNAKLNINGEIVDKGKGLMSNPNLELGKWILRDILKIKPGVLVTMDDLYDIGIDSVEVTKINDDYYEINFKDIGSFERFLSNTE